eukprot:IDg20451t1
MHVFKRIHGTQTNHAIQLFNGSASVLIVEEYNRTMSVQLVPQYHCIFHSLRDTFLAFPTVETALSPPELIPLGYVAANEQLPNNFVTSLKFPNSSKV